MNGALSPELVAEAAVVAGVCARPVISKLTDMDTGELRLVPIACGSTREHRCAACAERARRLRMQQCREGWHLDSEPEWRPGEQDKDDDDEDDEGQGDENARRVRSTRRRQDVPDLPRVPVEDRTIGRVFTAPDGKTYRPSMFVTVTLPSYGRVTAEGVPVNPATYDYRRAALGRVALPEAGGPVLAEPAPLRRLPGPVLRCRRGPTPPSPPLARRHPGHQSLAASSAAVRAATYHQVWWPAHDSAVYEGRRLPIWTDAGYADPDTGELLPTWDEALDALDGDPDAVPAHVVRFGEQDDIQGLVAGTPGVDRAIGYLCKYLPKDIAGTYDDSDGSPARVAHIDRLAEEVRWLPCAPTCANWLRYGIQPAAAQAGMVPGHCKHKAHDRDNLGVGGRRVLVSRKWSGKTLAGHKADRATVVRAALEEAGIDPDDHDELAVVGSDGRWSWELLGRNRVDAATYAAAIAQTITTRQRWRAEYERAKATNAARAGPAPPAAA